MYMSKKNKTIPIRCHNERKHGPADICGVFSCAVEIDNQVVKIYHRCNKCHLVWVTLVDTKSGIITNHPLEGTIKDNLKFIDELQIID